MKQLLRQLAVFLLAAAPLVAQPPVEPPVVGRPVDFSGLVGSYEVTATAAPTELVAEDPLVLTVHISGTGPPAYQPRRERLHLFPAEVANDFYVKPLPDKDRYLAAEKTWEFAYELRPKHPGIKKVPALRLVYYDPAYGKYQKSYAPSIPLTVKPRPQAQPSAEAVPGMPVPEAVYQLAAGPAVLRRQGSGWPGWVVLILLLIAPPLLAGLWYAWWRYRHPDAARLARQRRSQAAEHALKALKQSPDADHVARLLAGYLHQRLDLPMAEPTPREVARHLRHLALAPALVRRVADLFRACDAVRFAPAPPAADGLVAEASRLILDLETESCSSRV
jgi:hypothetical protein